MKRGKGLSRRAVLRGALGTVISLPLLEHMLDGNGEAYADGSALPCRYFTFYCPTALVTSGSRSDALTPTRTGLGYDVTPVLMPLADRGVVEDVSVVTGLFVAPLDVPGGYDVDYHGQATYAIMTGLRSGFSGVEWRPQGWSADQLVARAVGAATRFPYLYYQIDPASGGTRVCYEETRGFSDEPEIVYRGIDPQISPSLAYRALFTGFVPPTETGPDPEAELEQRLRVSSLSYAGEQIRAFQTRLGANDRQILDEHLTRVRELELRLAAGVTTPMTMSCRDPAHPDTDPADLATDLPDQEARASLFVELVELAFACDATRVLTLAGSSILTGPGMRHDLWSAIGGLHGEVQHASEQSDLDDANRWFVDVYARVIERLKATPEGAGTALDRTVALFVMEGGKGLSSDPMRSGDGGGDPNHSVDNAVMLVGGRAGGLRSGQHVSLAGRDLHHATVMNTAMRAVGVDAQLGEIAGTVDELLG
jgi:hypothetical protein